VKSGQGHQGHKKSFYSYVSDKGKTRENMDKLEKSACVNLKRFYKAKCRVLHLGWGNFWYQARG